MTEPNEVLSIPVVWLKVRDQLQDFLPEAIFN